MDNMEVNMNTKENKKLIISIVIIVLIISIVGG